MEESAGGQSDTILFLVSSFNLLFLKIQTNKRGLFQVEEIYLFSHLFLDSQKFNLIFQLKQFLKLDLKSKNSTKKLSI